MAKKKHWWWKFEPDRFLADEALRQCSWAAKGLWITMLSLMSKNAKVGYLGSGPNPPTPEQLARLVGGSVDEVSALVAELITFGVPSISGDGFIYSRKMVREHEDFIRAQEDGSRGGNPTLKGMVNPSHNQDAKGSLSLVSNSVSFSLLENRGMQGGIAATGPPPSTAVYLPESIVVLLRTWQRSDYVNSTQMDLLAALVNDYDLETVRNAMQTHIESGPQDAVGKWPYLRGICKRMVGKGEKPGAKSAAQQAAEIEARKKARRDRAGV